MPADWLRLPATCHHNSAKLMELARTFAETQDDSNFMRNKPMLFYLWGHSYEFDRNDNWAHMEAICQKFAGNEELWFATNIEIYDYVQAYKSLRYSADGHTVYNPTLLTIWLDADGKPYCIQSGETIRIN